MPRSPARTHGAPSGGADQVWHLAWSRLSDGGTRGIASSAPDSRPPGGPTGRSVGGAPHRGSASSRSVTGEGCRLPQDIPLSLRDSAGTICSTSQCSTIVPSSKRKMSMPRVVLVAGPVLVAVEDGEVALCHGPDELDALAGILGGHPLEVVDEGLLAIRDVRIVLDVLVPDVALDGLSGAALVEHQVIELHRQRLQVVGHAEDSRRRRSGCAGGVLAHFAAIGRDPAPPAAAQR
jgi:hypothetical protein